MEVVPAVLLAEGDPLRWFWHERVPVRYAVSMYIRYVCSACLTWKRWFAPLPDVRTDTSYMYRSLARSLAHRQASSASQPGCGTGPPGLRSSSLPGGASERASERFLPVRYEYIVHVQCPLARSLHVQCVSCREDRPARSLARSPSTAKGLSCTAGSERFPVRHLIRALQCVSCRGPQETFPVAPRSLLPSVAHLICIQSGNARSLTGAGEGAPGVHHHHVHLPRLRQRNPYTSPHQRFPVRYAIYTYTVSSGTITAV